MAVEIKIPSLGESINEVVLAQWLKEDGEYVEKDEPVVELETDKVNQELTAEEAGVMHQSAQEGDTLSVGDVVGSIEPGGKEEASEEEKEEKPAKEKKEKKEKEEDQREEPSEEKPKKTKKKKEDAGGKEEQPRRITPVARKMAEEYDVKVDELEGHGPGGRITREDVENYLEQKQEGGGEKEEEKKEKSPRAEPVMVKEERKAREPEPKPMTSEERAGRGERNTRRERISQLRKRVASRLVEVQQNAAILTTFNEVDMTAVMDVRSRYKEAFKEKHGVSLGLMSFFVKASVEALKAYPRVNAQLQSDEILYHDYMDVGIAVGSDRGLVVPVLRNAEKRSFAEIEFAIRDFAARAQNGKLTLEELQGGTFTITNGGVYGSMLSTPIINPPQSGILGMHNIVKRPMALNDEVKIRPMMYVALSYDHRLIDGKEAVSFLVRLKECLENPERMLIEV